MKNDENFPKPIAIINKNTLVFLESDIIPYEQKRKELTDSNYKEWHTTRKWLYKDLWERLNRKLRFRFKF